MSILSADEIGNFVRDQIPTNTKNKTKYDVRIFQSWLNNVATSETRKLEEIPPAVLNDYLQSFYLTVKKKDGNDYEPDSLSAIQNSLDRYLCEKNYGTSIIRGDEFKVSRTVLKSKRMKLRQEGKGRKPNRAEPVSNDEESVLWQKGILGSSTPEALQNAIWWRNNFFGLRGRDEHHKLKWGDIMIESKIACEGQERRYIKFKERDTKTRKDPGHDRPFDPKLYETPETPTRCPVRLLLEFTHRRPVAMCQPDAPFYIQIHPSYQKQQIWYKCQPLGVHSLGHVMKKMASDGDLPGRKTNHSGRKTNVKRLREASIDNVDIMQLTGHKIAESLNHYSTVSSKKQKVMSDILTNSSLSSIDVKNSHAEVSDKKITNKPETVFAPSPEDIDYLFADDFDVDQVLQQIETYELNCADPEIPSCSLNTTPSTTAYNVESCQQVSTEYKSVSTDLCLQLKAMGLANTLFSGASISGGNFNITINFASKE